MSSSSQPVMKDVSIPYRPLKFPLNDSKGTTGVGMTSGIFEPSELAEMREVFEEITAQRWFSRDLDTRRGVLGDICSKTIQTGVMIQQSIARWSRRRHANIFRTYHPKTVSAVLSVAAIAPP